MNLFHQVRDWFLQGPELECIKLTFILELLWEMAHFPLYTVWHENTFDTISYALVHCTIGDVMIMLSCYSLVSLLVRNRNWHRNSSFWKVAMFTVLGVIYTVYSEYRNVYINGAWAYTDRMPLTPWIPVGLTPVLQWMFIPPVLVWLMQRTLHGKDDQV